MRLVLPQFLRGELLLDVQSSRAFGSVYLALAWLKEPGARKAAHVLQALPVFAQDQLLLGFQLTWLFSVRHV